MRSGWITNQIWKDRAIARMTIGKHFVKPQKPSWQQKYIFYVTQSQRVKWVVGRPKKENVCLCLCTKWILMVIFPTRDEFFFHPDCNSRTHAISWLTTERECDKINKNAMIVFLGLNLLYSIDPQSPLWPQAISCLFNGTNSGRDL